MKLLLETNFSPGDVIVLSAAVRDLITLNSDKFRLNVWQGNGQAYPEIWENNPYIDPTITPANSDKRIFMDYGQFIKEADEKQEGHFAHAFQKLLMEVLGIEFELGEARPDIHLTEQEKSERPQDKPYWVIVPGGKFDFTTKWWPADRWQKLIDMRTDITFVQLGSAGKNCYNPQLRRVTSKVNQTTLRQMMTYIYHSEGVICGITSAMHIAAAFKKPAFILAGGREGPWWEKYPEHTFAHSVGALDCCLTKPCWKRHTELKSVSHTEIDREKHVCTNTTGTPPIPKCMDLIRPITVSRFLSNQYTSTETPEVNRNSTVLTNEIKLKHDRIPGVTICVCLYGTNGQARDNKTTGEKMDYHDLHVRCLKSIMDKTPYDYQFVLGLNEVDPKTVRWISTHIPREKLKQVIIHPKNTNKYPMMREMFEHVDTPWTVWFDDDSFVTNDNWLRSALFHARNHYGVTGKLYRYDLQMGQLQWIQKAPWFTGVPPLTDEDGKIYTLFITGGYQLIKTEVIKNLNWPDIRLDHNGGDVMFGEACRQNGYELKNIADEDMGVVISGADRRGTSQRSAGMAGPEKLTTMSPEMLASSYLDREKLLMLVNDDTFIDIFPVLKNNRTSIEQVIVGISKLKNKLTDANCKKCNRGRIQREIHHEEHTLIQLCAQALRAATDEQKSNLLKYMQMDSKIPVKKVFCETVGTIVE